MKGSYFTVWKQISILRRKILAYVLILTSCGCETGYFDARTTPGQKSASGGVAFLLQVKLSTLQGYLAHMKTPTPLEALLGR